MNEKLTNFPIQLATMNHWNLWNLEALSNMDICARHVFDLSKVPFLFLTNTLQSSLEHLKGRAPVHLLFIGKYQGTGSLCKIKIVWEILQMSAILKNNKLKG